MVHRRMLGIGVALGVVLSGFGGSVALAQSPAITSVAAPSSGAPIAEGIYQVQAAPSIQGQAAVVVAIEIPPNIKLPARVRIPVPPNCTPTWVGEILGGDPSADPQRTYQTVQGTGGQALELTIEQTRTAQAEFSAPVSASGTKVTMNVTWIQASPSTRTDFSVRTPPGSSQVSITPTPEGQPAVNPDGESLYGLPSKTMKPGESAIIAVSYTSGQAGQPTASTSSGGGSSVLYVLIAALFVVIVVLIFAMISRRSRSE